MKVVNVKPLSPNTALLVTIHALAEKVMSGEIQAMAFAWLTPKDAGHCYVASEEDLDERLLLAELQLCTIDTSISIASTDPQTFSSKLLTDDDVVD